MVSVFKMQDIIGSGKILPGKNHFIWKDEKRRNDEIIHLELPYTLGNYAMFYKGSHRILVNAAFAMDRINSGKSSDIARDYGILIQSLHVVHHISTIRRKSKLNGINSLSTSCRDNDYCLARMLSGDSICKHCYSNTQQKTQLALQDRNTINGIILRNIIIPVWAWKQFFDKNDLSDYFRIESFGDVQNVTQCINYINLCKAFPEVHFTVWSKNIGVWKLAFLQEEKPKNLVYVHSSNCVNKPETWILKAFSFVDHIFTVYDKHFVKENGIKITCGGRACEECIKKGRKCYFRDKENALVNEELK